MEPAVMLLGSKVHCRLKNLEPYLTFKTKIIGLEYSLDNKVKVILVMFNYELSLALVQQSGYLV